MLWHILIVFELNIFQKKLKPYRQKNITTNIYWTQAYDSIMCGWFCIRFIDFMFEEKSFVDYTNLFSPNEYEENTKILFKYF